MRPAFPPSFTSTFLPFSCARRAANGMRLALLPLPLPPPAGAFVILGDANLDPAGGDGDRTAMAAFLADPRWQDPRPRDAAGNAATADWDPPPGPLRVDYVLPSAGLRVLATGLAPWVEGLHHRLVWVDVAF